MEKQKSFPLFEGAAQELLGITTTSAPAE